MPITTPTSKHVDLATQPVHPRDVTPDEAAKFYAAAREFFAAMRRELRLSPAGLQALAKFEARIEKSNA